METIIKDVKIINDGRIIKGASIHIKSDTIYKIYRKEVPESTLQSVGEIIEGEGRYIIPGVIDDQVHFRDPGLTHKGDVATESKAAIAGGVTSFMEMPNTNPQTVTIDALEAKFKRASEVSLANFSFYLGATNDNLDEIKKIDPKRVCGVKIFMGSSTGNMLVDSDVMLSRIFQESPVLITTHCEDEATIVANTEAAREKFGDDVPISYHPVIRDADACYRSSSKAVELARKHGTRLHVLHISSEKEMALFEAKPLEEKRITAEVCVHHLWFDSMDYEKYGTKIKWNPAIKGPKDREALIAALNSGRIDVVATDHAPHTKEEKQGTYFKAPSGGPLVQHSLPAMLELANRGTFSLETVVDKMCHAPAKLYEVKDRGYIKKGYKADLVLIEKTKWEVTPESLHYKCGWSPFEGEQFSFKVTDTIVNGNRVYSNNNGEEQFFEDVKGVALEFDR